MRFVFILLALVAQISVANAQMTLLGVGSPPQSGGGGCSQSTTLQARMDGSQNATAVQNLICGMVTDGTLAKLDAFYVLAINSTANANLNWVSTSFGLTNSGSTFTANQGYTGNRTSAFITTGFTPSTAGGNFTQNSASLGACVFSTSGTGNQGYLGGNDAGGSVYATIGNNGTMFYDANDGTFPTFSQASLLGLWSVSRTGSATMALYQNGSSVATSTAASISNLAAAIDLIAINNNGTAANFSDAQLGAAWIGGGLTATDESNMHTRLHTYFTAISAPTGC